MLGPRRLDRKRPQRQHLSIHLLRLTPQYAHGFIEQSAQICSFIQTSEMCDILPLQLWLKKWGLLQHATSDGSVHFIRRIWFLGMRQKRSRPHHLRRQGSGWHQGSLRLGSQTIQRPIQHQWVNTFWV